MKVFSRERYEAWCKKHNVTHDEDDVFPYDFYGAEFKPFAPNDTNGIVIGGQGGKCFCTVHWCEDVPDRKEANDV